MNNNLFFFRVDYADTIQDKSLTLTSAKKGFWICEK